MYCKDRDCPFKKVNYQNKRTGETYYHCDLIGMDVMHGYMECDLTEADRDRIKEEQRKAEEAIWISKPDWDEIINLAYSSTDEEDEDEEED